MFGLFKPKERWPGEAKLQAKVNHATSFWNRAEIETRVKLLRNIMKIEDEQIFRAHVYAPFAQLPYDLKLKLALAVEIMEETPGVFE